MIKCFQFLKDKYICGYEDGYIKEFNLNGILLKESKVHDNEVNIIIPFNDSYISGGYDGKLNIGDKTIQAHNDWITHITFYSDSIYSLGWDKNIKVWNKESKNNKPIRIIKTKNAFHFDIKDNFIVTANWDKSISLYDLNERKHLISNLRGHNDKVIKVKFSPDGNHVLSIDRSGKLLLWSIHDLLSSKQYYIELYNPEGYIPHNDIYWLDNSSFISISTSGFISLWKDNILSSQYLLPSFLNINTFLHYPYLYFINSSHTLSNITL